MKNKITIVAVNTYSKVGQSNFYVFVESCDVDNTANESALSSLLPFTFKLVKNNSIDIMI